MPNLIHKIRDFFNFKNTYKKTKQSKRYLAFQKKLRTSPFLSFFLALGLLLLLIIIGSVLGSIGKKETEKNSIVKSVSVYKIGEAPKVTLQAKIEKTGIIKIVAQSGGIVNKINVTEGEDVAVGKPLLSLSSNYQGGSIPGLQSQLAGTQLKNINETFDTQKELIQKQREVANQNETNTSELREISVKSLDDTRTLLSQNEDILNTLNDNLTELEEANTNGQNDPLILQTKQLRSQFQSGVAQLKNQTRSLEYQANEENPPTKLSELQKDITLKQLSVQDKALDLQREVSRIQYQIAGVALSLMNPTVPFGSKIEKIHVQEGESVNPGTVLMTVSCLTNIHSTAEILVPREIAQNVSRVEPSIIRINGNNISVTPFYISTVATDGQLYSVLFDLPDGVLDASTDGEYVSIDVPIGYPNTSATIPFVPIDSIYQSQDESFIYVVNGNKTESRNITLGTIYGRYVEVKKGLEKGDMVITDRNVVAGDQIKIKN